jgi:hypothetical protein
MDTTTYASAAALPISAARYEKHDVAPETVLTLMVIFWICGI